VPHIEICIFELDGSVMHYYITNIYGFDVKLEVGPGILRRAKVEVTEFLKDGKRFRYG
jgi:hypothetical protein